MGATRTAAPPADQNAPHRRAASGLGGIGGRAEQGFLVLADISGFTAFVTATELEHGSQIVADLLEKVIERLSPPLELQEVEGDAVFALGPDHRLPASALLLDHLHGAFLAFKARQSEMVATETCLCNACQRVSTLSLKFVAHHGTFLRQLVGGRRQVAGTAVILAHRLLKNGAGRTGGYLLLTRAAVVSLGIDPAWDGLRAHTERYEHLGEVQCFIHDLEPN